MTRLYGPEGKHNADRAGYRHGAEDGSVTLGGRRLPVTRPRARAADGSCELHLPSYQLFSSTEILGQLAMEKMPAGLSSRRYRAGLEPTGKVQAAEIPQPRIWSPPLARGSMRQFSDARHSPYDIRLMVPACMPGAKAEGSAFMSLYGGMEFTEAPAGQAATALRSYPGVALAFPVAPIHTVTIGGTDIGFYYVAPANLVPWVGAQRNNGLELLRDGRVRLTNDETSAEWVIEGHAIAGLTVDTMMQNMKLDIAKLLGLRQQLRSTIVALQGQHPGDHIILAPAAPLPPGAAAAPLSLGAPGPQGVFEYAPGGQVLGAAQITVQYESLPTITRICELNASRYLPGTKIEVGDDADMVAGTLGLEQRARYGFGQSSLSSAQTLLQELTKIAAPVVAAGVTELTAPQVGLIMLMVLNDAMATTLRRYAANEGATADKNIQRFFPKSQRQLYVNAVAQATSRRRPWRSCAGSSPRPRRPWPSWNSIAATPTR